MTAQTNFHRCAAHHRTERVDGTPRKRSVACLLGISPLLFCLTGCHPAESDVASASPPSATRPVAVRTALVRKENVVPEITLVGTVTAIRRSIVGSPVEGRVTQLNVGEGDLVEMVSEGDQLRGEPIAQLSTEPISIEIAAATAELTDQRTRTFPVRIRLANPTRESGHLLRDGMQARATLSGSPRPTILVPKDALILGGANPVVMVAQEIADGQIVAVRLEVEAGVARGGMIEVHGELQPGQRVIVSGNERVQAGQVLRVIADASDVGADSPSG